MLIVKCNKSWIPHRKWLINNLFKRFNIQVSLEFGEFNEWIITVLDNPGSISFPDLYFKNSEKIKALPDSKPYDISPWCYFEVNNKKFHLPILFGSIEKNSWNSEQTLKQDNYKINVDIFGTSFWIMNRIEELDINILDMHNRFSAFNSHSWKNNYLSVPVVDYYIDFLKELINLKWPRLNIIYKREFNVFVSHDVDDPFSFKFMPFKKAFLLMAAKTIKNKSPYLGINIIYNYAKKLTGLNYIDPCDTFSWIMDQSEQLGIKSTFFFMSTDRSCNLDANYNIQNELIIELMKNINSRGHEIGIHPGYNSFQNEKLIETQINLLKDTLKNASINFNNIGCRMHYLRWDSKITPRILATIGLKYDSTLGFADYPGFRTGTCHPFYYFDLTNEIETTLLIRPLIAMEATILSNRYMNTQSTEEAYSILLNLKNKCKDVNGEFSLLWHNSYFYTNEERNLYKSILKN